ncbi:fused isobutyryl-CoA mutase/GTPase IcmF [Desulforhopalus sp. IMCC35007]|uniref:fused isobutyryl-CoA mutase/GTPase IcmF n=1 Tax=Desulforhopalus sp. IMCC35007 TaxID=2569543 RepID=UPI0010AE07A0|nr:fused isobutyryl-CoA mutase/GTPase IcmF [Desulforhopalus sp. IMCC35007]TKB11165.1 methylmalonyl-CoA mutase [Desulforhopalus sp. IMCC35007]
MQVDVEIYRPKNVVRVITATSLFDGHDASTNIMRRILQDSGVEVIHLAHNRSVQELVETAIEEDAQGIAMSSYQGGHMEAFKYMIDLLKEKDSSHIKVFGGGGGVIVADEIKELEAYGVAKIYSPEDGNTMGLQGMINHMIGILDFSTLPFHKLDPAKLSHTEAKTIAGFITAVQQAKRGDQDKYEQLINMLAPLAKKNNPPVIGITGTGGAGKSSLTDEIIVRFLHDIKDIRIAIISCDPSRRKTGGALLGDRIRMNSISGSDKVYMRSLATQESATEVSEVLPEAIQVVKAAGFDLIIAETAGIGQGDSKITELSDISMYVMTSEYGAPSQLEKIDMLDYADLIVINKFEKKGSDDALRDIRKQVQRNRKAWGTPPEQFPVYGTIASKFNDDGITALYHGIIEQLNEKSGLHLVSNLEKSSQKFSSSKTIVIPSERIRYLAEIASTIREYHKKTDKQTEALRLSNHVTKTIELLLAKSDSSIEQAIETLKVEAKIVAKGVDSQTQDTINQWLEMEKQYSGEELVYTVRGREIRVPLHTESLSHSKIPKISLPKFKDPGDIYRWIRKENLPGYFPFTGGVFPMKRAGEDPTRMFAGEGGPRQTNARFKLLSENYAAKRLSTAFDSVTLYGWDPAVRPDIYGKIGTSGVSICTLDDVKLLYDGFDLCAPTTSVSMTINGPAPIILAMFMNTAIDQQVDTFVAEMNRKPNESEYDGIKTKVLENVRGTVQADILKEDQGQNTCIFSIEFALKMMGDIQEFFIAQNVKNFYSVSVSGYHIAEAGANPITQLALTLSNGFTYVEYYLARGMDIDAIAANLSFFFSNGMDPEYTVIGRVARRIWSIAMKEKYGASTTSQRLKYHIQTSGRSLHSQEIQFNDIRTSLQALCAIYDNCNSLHTNAFDEAITTPSAESVRRALAIQLIINREWGLAKNENPNQGSFIVEELTDLVEEAVMVEFDRITDRGGVLGAMETGYQRSKIQEESMYYEYLKHSGAYPIIGVNTFRNPDIDYDAQTATLELARSTDEEKNEQIDRLAQFHSKHQTECPKALNRLKEVALGNGNIFEELLHTVRHCSLGQITNALYEVGGQYRRNM